MGGLVSAKFLFVLLVGLIVLGPEKLPEVARSAGRLISEFRRVTGNLQTEVRDAFDTSELAAPVREFRAATQSFRSAATGWVGPVLSGAAPEPGAAEGSRVSTTGPAGSVGRVTTQTTGSATPRPALWPAELGPAPGDPSLN